MEVFWFSALETQNLTDRPSGASCFLCQTLVSFMAELLPRNWLTSELVSYVWSSR